MLPQFTPSDFTGYTAVSTDRFSDSVFQEYIDEYTPIYFRRLLGDDATNEISTLDPLPQKWVDLLEGVTYFDEHTQLTAQNTGFNRVVKFCLYYEFVRSAMYANSVVGVVVNNNENSQPIKGAVNSVQAWKRKAQGFDEFNKQVIPFLNYYQSITENVTASNDLGSGNYEITLDSSLYLADGDTFTLSGEDYIATTVVGNVVTFNAVNAGLGFTGKKATWKPFEKVMYCHQYANLM